MDKIYGVYTPKEYSEKLLGDLLRHKITVEEGKGGQDYDDFVLRFDGYVEIYEKDDVVITETIAKTVKGKGYEVGRVKVYHNYPHEPDDYDFEAEEECPTILKAIWIAVGLIMKDELDRAIEGISETLYAKELEEEAERIKLCEGDD